MKFKNTVPPLFLANLFIIMQTPCAFTSTTTVQTKTTQQIPTPLRQTASIPAAVTPSSVTPSQPTEVQNPSIIKTRTVSGRTEFPICASLPLTGELSVIGKNIADGMNLFFNAQRQEKKKPKILPKLYSKDNQSNITTTQRDVAELQTKSPIFLSITGNNALATLLEDIDHEKIMGLFPIDGTTNYRTSTHKNLIFFRPDHEAEIDALIHYATKELNKFKIALFYESSEWGEDCRKALKKILPKYKATLVAESFYPQDTLNVTKAVQDISISAPNAIFVIAQSRAAYSFIQQIINKGLHKTSFLCLSTLIPIQETLWKSRGVHIIASSVVPYPSKSHLPIAKEFRRAVQRFLPNRKPSAFLLEGYINAALTTEILKLVVQPPCTIDSIRTALENMGKVNFKGLTLSFDPNTRTLSHDVWINTGHEVAQWFLAKDKRKISKKKRVPKK